MQYELSPAEKIDLFFLQILMVLPNPTDVTLLAGTDTKTVSGEEFRWMGKDKYTVLNAFWRHGRNVNGYRYIGLHVERCFGVALTIETLELPPVAAKMPLHMIGLSGQAEPGGSVILTGPTGHAVGEAFKQYIDTMYE